jgi:hypothetical protein
MEKQKLNARQQRLEKFLQAVEAAMRLIYWIWQKICCKS